MKGKHWKKWLICAVSLLVAAAVIAGIWLMSRGSGKTVNVYPFRMLGMTEYWGDSQESYGPVSAENIQTFFLSDTQTVTEILVEAGDRVKKGDVLLRFDTSLTELSLERKRLDVEKKKLQLKQANDYLIDLGNMKPMVVPPPPEPEDEADQGRKLKGRYEIFSDADYDGSTASKAVICWIREGDVIDDDILEAVRDEVEKRQNSSRQKAAFRLEPLAGNVTRQTPVLTLVPLSLTRQTTEPTGETTKPTDETTKPTDETTQPTDETTQPTEETTQPTEETTQPTEETTQPTEETTQPTEETTQPTEATTQPTEATTAPTQETTVPTEAPEEPVDEYYVVVKMTKGNMSLGTGLLWQGLHVKGSGEHFGIGFFSAHEVPDHSLAPEEGEEQEAEPEFDYGSGYTAAQLAQMRSEQKKKIQELELAAKMAEAEYKLMLLEVEDGNVYAQLDGEVVSVLPEEEARLGNEPVIKVSAGGGFHVQGNVSELIKDQLKPGQEVTVNDWNTGMMYTGTVESVGDFPLGQDNWNGMGNPNASYYPFRVFVDGEANLQSGNYVSITYSTSGAESGIYLENPFIRQEQGKYYVYAAGADGKLEKRYVTVGKSLWGSYREILSGLSEEDLLAFPYGKDVKEGAAVVESDLSALYE